MNMCLSSKRQERIYGEMIQYIICELYKCTDKKLFSCQTFELLGKTYIKIILKTVKGVRRKMIFRFIDSHAEAHGEILNNKNSKCVYLCQKIIGVNRLPKDTYEMVSTKYNELFRVKYENVKRRIILSSAETEQKQKIVSADAAKIESKKFGILYDISSDEKQLLQYYRDNNSLRTKKDILAKIKIDLEEKFRTYCDFENESEITKKNRIIAIQYSTGIFESEDINNSFLPYEAYLEACENYLISYDKQSANIKIYPFFELARKEFEKNHRLNKENNDEQYTLEIKELMQYRDDLNIAIHESQKSEKTCEFIVQKNILSEVERYVNSLICLRKRKNLLKELLELYKAERFDIFVNLCTVQIEGVFNDLQYDLELFQRFQSISLDPTQDLKHKINSIEDNIPYEYVLYFGHCFNNLQRNIVAHGRWLLNQDAVKVANELLLDLHSLLYMVFRCSHLERMYRFIHNYVDTNSKIVGNCYGALYYDLTGERIHGDYDYIGHIEPKQVLLWIFNPFYERFYKEAADENDTSLEQIRNVLSSIAFWEYISDDIDEKLHNELINDNLSRFKLVLGEVMNCNISDKTRSKIKEIKAKLFKYEKAVSP
ncbi:MAG: hypothetical protein J6A83_10020 [Clostridia bacterium]|nr:hypothetical protein [Clostridia bacterium]